MKEIFIFGSGGQLGHDCIKTFKEGFLVRAFGHSEADITNLEILKKIFLKNKPWAVINATAYNKVEDSEKDPRQAFLVNHIGVENLAKMCLEVNAIFVHVSTDYVFDGSKQFFTETDTPNPLNQYGKSKLAGEEAIKKILNKYYIVRTSSVFGVKEGKQKINFVDKMISLAKSGQELKVVNDQIMSPTYSLDLAFKIKELIKKPAPFGVYHITNQGVCSWYEFTKKILEYMNLYFKISPISTLESGTKVNRPKQSVLKNKALEDLGLNKMPFWEDALHRYLKEKYDLSNIKSNRE